MKVFVILGIIFSSFFDVIDVQTEFQIARFCLPVESTAAKPNFGVIFENTRSTSIHLLQRLLSDSQRQLASFLLSIKAGRNIAALFNSTV